MANFIFPLVITLEQNTPAGATCRRIYKREYGAWLIALLPIKKKRPLMPRLANYVTGALLLDGPRLHVGVPQNNSANQLAMIGCKVAAQGVTHTHHRFNPT